LGAFKAEKKANLVNTTLIPACIHQSLVNSHPMRIIRHQLVEG